jgi:single-stranded-DNA-specific exonuclease
MERPMPPAGWIPNSYEWQVAPAVEAAGELARRAGLPALLARVLAARGVGDADSARTFLNPSLNDLHDPDLLAGSIEAADRILQAVRDGRRIVIFGDYDVDGMTAVAILHACLRELGGPPRWYIPHRLDEGYGLSDENIDQLIEEGVDLLITVDCGISAVESVARAARAGVEVIITDHHGLGESLPEAAAAIVHPALETADGDRYPNPHLAGAGVAFKLAWQIARRHAGSEKVDEPMRRFLLHATSLAALGTIADVVPLLGENRSLAHYGLRGVAVSEHVGLRALLESAKLDGKKIDAEHVGFVLAPRLNAAGRMGHARLALELLLEPEEGRARQIAAELARQNSLRQRVQRQIAAEAEQMARSAGLADDDRRSIVLHSPDWHGGVIGIVASHLVRKFSRPVFLIAENGDGVGQGSGRSVAGVNLLEAMTGCREHLLGYGGHAMAGGLKIAPERIADFAEALEAHCRKVLPDGPPRALLALDAEAAPAQLDGATVEALRKMAPFGQANPAPLLALRDCEVLTPPQRMGAGGAHAHFRVGRDGATLRAVGFGMGDLAEKLAGVKRVDLAGEPVLNRFRGRTSVELHLKDVKWA